MIKQEAINPMNGEFNGTLEKILEEARELIGKGRVAQYIPMLAKVNPKHLGIAIADREGNISSAGDANTPFSIQSLSKVFTFTQALQVYENAVWERVGREPSGQRFNSLMLLEVEAGIPRNPFINGGALLICDMLESRVSSPDFRLVDMLRRLSHNPRIASNKRVAESELQHSARNSAMGYLMQSHGNFHNPVDKVLASYTHHCAIEMSCVDMVKACMYMANGGVSLRGETILSAEQTKQVNALLATCGLYDEAGDFAFRVGLPGKSGVGGGIFAIYPGHYTICVYSPELNPAGNSLAGIFALQRLTEELSISVY
jgi:glutaminase